MKPVGRTLRESNHLSERLRELRLDPKSWDELWFGLDHTIALDPSVGTPLAGTPYWLIATSRAPAWGLPRLRVLYRFDDQFVDLIDIDLAE